MDVEHAPFELRHRHLRLAQPQILVIVAPGFAQPLIAHVLLVDGLQLDHRRPVVPDAVPRLRGPCVLLNGIAHR